MAIDIVPDSLAEENSVCPLIYSKYKPEPIPEPTLIPVQRYVLKAYFDQYLKEYTTVLINSAPADLQALRAHLALCSTELKPEYFQELIKKSYPIPDNSAPASIKKQNQTLRKFYIVFNELCQHPDSINHLLYQQTFDSRFLVEEPHSPTKQNLLSKYFKSKIKKHFKTFINQDDDWVVAAQDFIRSISPTPKKPSIARKLF